MINENNEHAVTAVSKAVWQGRNKPAGATGVASRPVKRRIVRHASRLLNWDRGRVDGYVTCRAGNERPYGARLDAMEVQGTQASWSLRSEEVERKLADADVVHADRSIQCRLLQYQMNWQKVK